MDLTSMIGFIAAALTTTSFVPQAIKIIRTKGTKDLSMFMYSMLTFGLFLWFIYGILLKDLPLIIANGITLLFSATVLILKIKYK